MKPAAVLLFAAAILTAEPGSIAGTVLHSVSNSPVRKATVTLIAPKFRLNASTDLEGHYQFTALPPGTYRVVASLAGFADRPALRPLHVGPDAKLTVPPLRLRLRKAVSSAGLDSASSIDACVRYLYPMSPFPAFLQNWRHSTHPTLMAIPPRAGPGRWP